MRRSPGQLYVDVMSWLKTPIAKRDLSTVARVLGAIEAKLKRKVDSWIPVALWFGVRLEVQCRTRGARFRRRLERAREVSLVSSRRVAFYLANARLSICVSLLKASASLRTKCVLRQRSIRLHIALIRDGMRSKFRLKPILWALEASLWVLAAGTFGY